jgi:hypothetical protein
MKERKEEGRMWIDDVRSNMLRRNPDTQAVLEGAVACEARPLKGRGCW